MIGHFIPYIHETSPLHTTMTTADLGAIAMSEHVASSPMAVKASTRRSPYRTHSRWLGTAPRM
jgi:hypothetical protein